ncbi:MAG: hypothetical protein ACRCWR_01190 [Saezia sp.]
MTTSNQDDPKARVANDGLRYHSKINGSPFISSSSFGAATMSCFLCGIHRPRTLLKSRRLLGQMQFVCAPTCNELKEKLDK